MSYLTKVDLENSIEDTLLTALNFAEDKTDEDGGSVITTACSQAESQLRAYLSGRYAIADELELATGRNELLLMLAKDMAIYHIWTYVDPASIPASRRERYNAAIAFLKEAQAGEALINIDAAAVSSTVEGGSNNKRINHY